MDAYWVPIEIFANSCLLKGMSRDYLIMIFTAFFAKVSANFSEKAVTITFPHGQLLLWINSFHLCCNHWFKGAFFFESYSGQSPISSPVIDSLTKTSELWSHFFNIFIESSVLSFCCWSGHRSFARQRAESLLVFFKQNCIDWTEIY